MKWRTDVALGVRLAVGGGRTAKTSLLRLMLITIGIGLSTAVLLLLVTAVTAMSHRNDRLAARDARPTEKTTAPLIQSDQRMIYRGDDIGTVYLEPMTPAAPVPPGVRAIPAAGEMVVSPALAAKLASDGDLRARFDERVVGTIAPDGLAGPNELRAYLGADGLRGSRSAQGIAGFGGRSEDVPAPLLFLGVLGVLVLLVPLLVFVAATSRISGAERERRLSALRLAGAGSRQVRRIAAAESLVGAATGGLLGLVVYLVIRPYAARFDIAGITVFPADFVPAWPFVAAVFLLLPVITVGSAWFGMRQIVVEPLGVVRRAGTVRRRGWWRLLLVALGVVVLFPDKLFGVPHRPGDTLPYLSLGAVLLLIGVPTLLPWVTERAVSRLRGGFPAWQLAVRRLQQDSGTPARVVAGVVVVLAGVIALQVLLDSVTAGQTSLAQYSTPSAVGVYLDGADPVDAVARVRGQPGVRTAFVQYRGELTGDRRGGYSLLVAPCELLERDYRLPGCADGDAFVLGGQGPRPGMSLSLSGQPPSGFTVPAAAKTAWLDARVWQSEVLLTPGAAKTIDPSVLTPSLDVSLEPGDPGALQRVYAAMAPLGWRASVYSTEVIDNGSDNYLAALQGLLYAGALLTLSLAGVSLIVMTVGQISERRRSLAAMSAGGVPRGVLERSVLWQNAIPLIFGVLVAVATGIGSGALIMRLMDARLSFMVNGTFVVVLAVAAVSLVLLVTAAALPTLRSATRLEAVRAE